MFSNAYNGCALTLVIGLFLPSYLMLSNSCNWCFCLKTGDYPVTAHNINCCITFASCVCLSFVSWKEGGKKRYTDLEINMICNILKLFIRDFVLNFVLYLRKSPSQHRHGVSNDDVMIITYFYHLSQWLLVQHVCCGRAGSRRVEQSRVVPTYYGKKTELPEIERSWTLHNLKYVHF
jgi:hypothetical protein